MPIEFIPNQPVVFENPIGDYPCLNNDPKVYGPLMQSGDEMCIQWKLGSCGTPLCEPDMVGIPGTDELGAWTVTGGWDTTGSSNLSFDGVGNPTGDAIQQISGLSPGTVYKLTFDVNIYTGTAIYSIYWFSNSAPIFDFSATGSYTVYFVAQASLQTIKFYHNGTSTFADQLLIENLEVVQWTQCWQQGDLTSGDHAWIYEYNTLIQEGRFCSNVNEDSLINTQAFVNTGNYHGITFVISNCTQGGLEVYVDGGTTPIGTTSGNGQFTYYGNPSTQDLIFNKVGSFDGCISQVTVNDYGVINDYDITFENEGATVTSSVATPTAYDDRLVWCGNWNNLTWTVNGTPDLEPTCGKYYTKIYDPCDDVTHTSVNLINYDRDGHECTKFVEAWNDGYAFGFYFGDVNAPDFKLKQRLRVLAFNPVYRNSGEEYLYSSGQTVRSYAQSQKARTAWFDYADEYCHDTIRTQLLSQKLTIEGVSFYFPTEDYEPEWNDRGKYNLAQSRVTLFHELSTFGSTCGIIANPFCPPTQQAAIITQVSLVMDAFDTTGFDLTNTAYLTYEISSNGIYGAVGNASPFDLTVSGNRTTLLNDIIYSLNSYYATSFSGSISLSGTVLTINCTAQINTVLPVKIWSIALIDGAGQAIPITTTFQ